MILKIKKYIYKKTYDIKHEKLPSKQRVKFLVNHLDRHTMNYSYSIACPPVRGDYPRALAS